MDEQRRIMVAMAHPDDPEYSCAAAVSAWTRQGHEVRYVLATRGEAGENGPQDVPWHTAQVRMAEQRNAAKAVGVDVVEFLGFPDGRVMYTPELRCAFARAIRQFKPHLIVTMNFDLTWGGESINQADHRIVGVAVLDAVRDAANRWIFPRLLDEGLEPWEELHEAYVAGAAQPDTEVTIDNQDVQRAVQALKAHASYVGTLDVTAWVDRYTMGIDGTRRVQFKRYQV